MEGSSADGVRVTVDAAWSDDRKVLCYLEEPANPATVTEQLETEKDAHELFTQRARQVDFFKYEKGDEEGAEARTREAQKKREERMRLEATRRDAIFARMRHAMGEMELMFGFIDMAQRGEHLATALIQKQPPPVSRAVDSQAFTILAKQKQLEKAATDLTKAATRLRTLVAREKRYNDEILTLRKEVKLRGRPPRAIVAEYAIPCCGSSADACEVDLRKTRTGEVVVHMAPSRVDKSLHILTTHRHSTYSLPLASQGREDAEEATGATATAALLSRALRSQFCAELFRELSEGVSEATRQGHKSEWWWSSHAHVFENEITFYDATIRARPLSIRLASSRTAPPDGTEWVEGMGEEDALAVHHYDEDEHKDGEGNIADTLTVLLFKLWRQHQDQLLRLQINPAPPTPPARRVGIRMANALFDTFRHHCLRQRLHARLSALSASTPFLATHWFLSPKSPTVSSFNVLFASSLVVHVVVDGTKIVCGSAKPIFSDEEFIEHLLMQLSHRLLGDLHQAAMQEGRPVEKRDLSLLFPSLTDKATTIEVSLVSLVQSHQLQIMQKVMVAEEDHATATATAAAGRGGAGKEPGASGDKPATGGRGATASQSVVTSHHFFPLTNALGGTAGGLPASSSRRDATYALVLQRWLHLAATER